MHISMAIISMPECMGTVEAIWRMRFIFCRIGFVQAESASCRFMWQNQILFLNRANLFLCFTIFHFTHVAPYFVFISFSVAVARTQNNSYLCSALTGGPSDQSPSGRSAVRQRTWFGTRWSQVRILSPRLRLNAVNQDVILFCCVF